MYGMRCAMTALTAQAGRRNGCWHTFVRCPARTSTRSVSNRSSGWWTGGCRQKGRPPSSLRTWRSFDGRIDNSVPEALALAGLADEVAHPFLQVGLRAAHDQVAGGPEITGRVVHFVARELV